MYKQQQTLLTILTGLLLVAISSNAALAQTVLIKGANVHTALKNEVLENTDVLIEDGGIESIGKKLSVPDDAQVIEANGRSLTPGLFGGVTGLGLEEVSLEQNTVDNAISFQQQMRPEFDVTLGFNPHSAVIDANRVEGITWTLLGAASREGGSVIAGQGGAVTLDGRYDAVLEGSRSLFINLGAGTSALSGNSRAAHYMLLSQALNETRSAPRNLQNSSVLLSDLGRGIMSRYLKDGQWVVAVNRASDIVQVLKLAKQSDLNIIILGGAEAWRVADRLAAADVPVILDPLENLPGSFDSIGARLDNAAILANAGVRIAFTNGGDATHNARKVRQVAGNAVANGLSWYVALRAITRNPAIMLGLEDKLGGIRSGMQADVVLWSGDPLEVTSYAEQVWINGKAIDMQSRQQDLLRRYLPESPSQPRHYLK